MAHVIREHLSHILETWRQGEQTWGTVILQNEPQEKPAKEMKKNLESRMSMKSRSKALQARVVCSVKAADGLSMIVA